MLLLQASFLSAIIGTFFLYPSQGSGQPQSDLEQSITGIFQFTNESLDVRVNEDQENITLKVQRLGGRFGKVKVGWMVTGDTHNDVSGNKHGSVVFENAEVLKAITIPLANDSIPELNRQLKVHLVTVSKGLLSQRNIISSVTLAPDDHPFGTFSIASGVRHLGVNNMIRRQTVILQRRGSTRGRVVVNVAAARPKEEHSFVPDGVILASQEVDFLYSPMSVVFSEDQTTAFTNVDILLSSRPEKTLSIFLYIKSLVILDDEYSDEPSMAAIGPWSESFTQIDIPGQQDLLLAAGLKDVGQLPSNMDESFHGIFQFDDRSLIVRCNEDKENVTLTVQRLGGRFGRVEVSWNITLDEFNDVSGDTTGTLVFENAEISKQIIIPLVNDDIPEFTKHLGVRLVSVSKGLLGQQNLISTIELTPNDNPAGIFFISPGDRHIWVVTLIRKHTVKIVRRGLSWGRVLVNIAAARPGEQHPFIPVGVNLAEPGRDFTYNPMSVVFHPKQTTAFINVEILLPSRPYKGLSIYLYIKSMEILEEKFGKEPSMAAISSSEESYTHIDIIGHQDFPKAGAMRDMPAGQANMSTMGFNEFADCSRGSSPLYRLAHITLACVIALLL